MSKPPPLREVEFVLPGESFLEHWLRNECAGRLSPDESHEQLLLVCGIEGPEHLGDMLSNIAERPACRRALSALSVAIRAHVESVTLLRRLVWAGKTQLKKERDQA